MVEIELKFQVPELHRSAISQVLMAKNAQTVHLQAKYYDTPDRKLAASKVGLRLRLEEKQWVQTLKCIGSSQLCRLEHEVNLGAVKSPVVDVDLHHGTPAGDVLFDVFDTTIDELVLQFETDIVRTLQHIDYQGAQIELALDVGEIRTSHASIPVFELEFELKSGAVEQLLSFVRDWVDRYELWLDVSSKAARGDQLVRGLAALPATLSTKPLLKKHQSVESALRDMMASCLQQILPNAAEIIGGAGGPEHVHQVRVGIRRLRSVLHVFGHWSEQVDDTWAVSLANLFNQLGVVRDRDALEELVLPALREAGAPFTELPASGSDEQNAAKALKVSSCNQLWLTLIEFIEVPTSLPAHEKDASNLTALASAEIKRMHQQLLQDAQVYISMEDAMRHRTRKRLKRLRYCVELLSSLYDKKQVQHYLEALRPMQDVLGQYNDVLIAESLFQQQVKHHAKAWFAVGWLAARRQQLLSESVFALQQLAQVKKFW